MNAKRSDPKKSLPSIEERLATLNRDYRFVPHTNAGRLSSSVRRMKAEKEMNIPIKLRSGAAVSVRPGKAKGKAADKMTEQQWEAFYKRMCEELRKAYPEIHAQIFPEDN
jgi:hypothetical protein